MHCYHIDARSTEPILLRPTSGALRQTVTTPSGGQFRNDTRTRFLTAVSPVRLPSIPWIRRLWRSRLANGIGGCYHAGMAKKPPPRQRKTITAGPFFDLLDQMEALTRERLDLNGQAADIRAVICVRTLAI